MPCDLKVGDQVIVSQRYARYAPGCKHWVGTKGKIITFLRHRTAVILTEGNAQLSFPVIDLDLILSTHENTIDGDLTDAM